MPPSTPKGASIAHVGIAVRALADAIPFYREILGMADVELADTDGARIAGFDAGGPVVELLEAGEANSPIARFIEKRGPGIHHICFAMDDLDAAIARCRNSGARLIDEAPRIGANGKKIAFLHPASTGGILIELTER
jgi:methylmalonyl-CoA/ethylmalonyl-CoA epimerase